MADRKAYWAEYRSRPEVKERQRQYQQDWRDRHPDKSVAMSARNRKKHRDAFNKQATAKRKRERDILAEYYIRHMLYKQMMFLIKPKNIHSELVEIQKIKLLTQRKLKSIKNGSHNINHLLTRHEKGIKRKPSRITNGQKKTISRKGSK